MHVYRPSDREERHPERCIAMSKFCTVATRNPCVCKNARAMFWEDELRGSSSWSLSIRRQIITSVARPIMSSCILHSLAKSPISSHLLNHSRSTGVSSGPNSPTVSYVVITAVVGTAVVTIAVVAPEQHA